MKTFSRRTLLRDLGTLTAAVALTGRPSYLKGQAPPAAPDPFANDITVFFIGPWLFLAKAPGKPSMMLAMTCDDSMHSYRHGLYNGTRPTASLPAGDYVAGITAPGARPAASPNLFGSLNSDLLCIDGSCDCIALAAPARVGMRRIYLPVPDSITPAMFIPQSTAAPLFVWPDKPVPQVLPTRAATALILRYANASALTLDNGLRAAKGDHVHFEIVIPSRPASPEAEQAHTIAFSAKLAQTLTYSGNTPNLTFHPGVNPVVDLGAPGVNPGEVGVVNPRVAFSRPLSRNDSTVHLSPASFVRTSAMSYENADCTGAIMAVSN